MDHVELVEALKDPGFYDPPVEQVEFIQTHISSVFLTGERVYKLKKPVNFGFLDFSTVELRKRYCRAEVELNRRLAPEVYLGVEPLTLEAGLLRIGGEGEVVDWLVVMRQGSQSRLNILTSTLRPTMKSLRYPAARPGSFPRQWRRPKNADGMRWMLFWSLAIRI